MASSKPSPDQLAQPGAGLPLFEQLYGRYVLFPVFCARTSWPKAVELFDTEYQTVVGLVRGVSTEQLNRKVLIDRLPGLEDSSRYWSVLMTLRHIIVVTNGIRRVAEALSMQRLDGLSAVQIEDFKPDEGPHSKEAVLRAYATLNEGFLAAMVDPLVKRPSPLKFAHPWFGDLDNEGWVKLAALHHQLHRQQIEAILSLL
ncbi:MAG: DinB family protein [Cyanobacteria bacterium HKST-UBA04]|nr:DinB family protein [Cyanobacteria bacterium HKST-UBA04]MCA9842984.1 DinB family protein [Cyanobacteria bacterium HKST-UBA03]